MVQNKNQNAALLASLSVLRVLRWLLRWYRHRPKQKTRPKIQIVFGRLGLYSVLSTLPRFSKLTKLVHRMFWLILLHIFSQLVNQTLLKLKNFASIRSRLRFWLSHCQTKCLLRLSFLPTWKRHICGKQMGTAPSKMTTNSSGDEIANVNFFYDDTFNHFYAVLPGSYRIRWNKGKEKKERKSIYMAKF